jgi:hypothetical protein
MFKQWQTMEPAMLVSIINLKLRNEHEGFEGFCRHYELDLEALSERLTNEGFSYAQAQQQWISM